MDDDPTGDDVPLEAGAPRLDAFRCPVCSLGTMVLTCKDDDEWFYRCAFCGSVAFP